MGKSNGHDAAARDLTHGLAAKTLSGDLRDIILKNIKQLKKPWEKMGELEQGSLIADIGWNAEHLVRKAVALIAAEGRPSVSGVIDTAKMGKGLELKVIASRMAEGRHELLDSQGSEILLIIPGVEKFLGQRKPAKATPDEPELPIGEDVTDAQIQAAHEQGLDDGKRGAALSSCPFTDDKLIAAYDLAWHEAQPPAGIKRGKGKAAAGEASP
jgi:hypothetical protein